jgi:geranylgeranyl reductase family protein
MRSEVYDVVVAGAGPAGSRLAWRLARGGARVALADASHPREKPCGGGVTGRALGLVADQIDLARLSGVAVARARFIHEDRIGEVALEHAGLSARSALVIASRTTFDRLLLDGAVAAGAAHVPWRVRDVVVEREGCEVALAGGRTLHSRFVVGADGAASLVRRRVSRPFERHALSIASGFFVHGVSDDTIDVEFASNPPGYLWSFPRPDHLAVGVCAPADISSSEELRSVASRWIAQRGLNGRSRLQPYSWPIPSLAAESLRHQRPAADRWLLVGDAAGLVDPITREGIFFALQSANLAADALLGGRNTPGEYLQALRGEVMEELRRAATLKAGFFRPRFTRLLIDALRSSGAVRAVMADLVAGRQPYRTLVPRLLSTLELRLAWRLLALRFSR